MSTPTDDLQAHKRIALASGLHAVKRIDSYGENQLTLYTSKKPPSGRRGVLQISLLAALRYKWRLVLEDDPIDKVLVRFFLLPASDWAYSSLYRADSFGVFLVKKTAKYYPTLQGLVLAAAFNNT